MFREGDWAALLYFSTYPTLSKVAFLVISLSRDEKDQNTAGGSTCLLSGFRCLQTFCWELRKHGRGQA